MFTFIFWLIGYATLVIILTIYIISKTSLKEYIPGYGGIEEKKMIFQLSEKVDSLEQTINIKSAYIQNILDVLKEKEKDSAAYSKLKENVSFKPKAHQLNSGNYPDASVGTKEKATRDEIEKELTSGHTHSFSDGEVNENFNFILPVKGMIVSKFDPIKKHNGIDIAGKLYDPVRSIDKGIVIYSDYSFRYGNCIVILHHNNFVSVYKHLSVRLKNEGDVVSSNDIIGTMGNTGTESTGVHLHFELWYNQNLLNPMDYALF
ncbi:MAG: M23 family metallopeptidase [Bacteroidia bacterium]